MPIASNLQALRETVMATVDARHAEPVRLSFLKSGIVDQTRPAVEISAVLRVGTGEDATMGGGVSDWRTHLSAGKAELHIDLATYAGPQIRLKDRVCAISRRGTPWFEVLRIDDRGATRLVLALGEV